MRFESLISLDESRLKLNLEFVGHLVPIEETGGMLFKIFNKPRPYKTRDSYSEN